MGDEAARAGRTIGRVTVAFEAGRDGFWLARWLRARDVEAYVIHPSSVPVPREHRRAKTDRLDTELLKRAFLGWLRGEPDHCSMAAVPTLEDEDARRPNRERESLVGERTRIVNRMKGNLARLGIRGFKPTLRKAPERLEALHTPEGPPLPPNTAAELRRDMARALHRDREAGACRLLRRSAGRVTAAGPARGRWCKSRTRAADRRWDGHRGAGRPGPGGQVCRPSSLVPSGSNLRVTGDRARSFYPQQLGWPSLLVARRVELDTMLAVDRRVSEEHHRS